MVLVNSTYGLPYEMYEKCRRYKINRSGVARRAIEQEIARVEREMPGMVQESPTEATN